MSVESNPGPSTASCASARVPRRRITISGMLALVVCVIHGLLFLALFSEDTEGSSILFFGMLSVYYLVIYVGFPLSVLLWGALMVYQVAVCKQRRRLIWRGVKYAVIILGAMGLTLWLIGTVPPTAKTFTVGYWFHAKVWADVDEIRAWAAEQNPAHDWFQSIPEKHWPSCLRRIPLSDGAVMYDPENSTVTFYEGGGFGHWGFTVAPKGTPVPEGWCVLRLEDGAWVWHESQ